MSGVPDRDGLIAAIYEAAIDPNAYGRFVAALSEYLEHTAAKAWKIRDLSEIDVSAIEADRGLMLHFENLNRKLADAPDRVAPGSLRERIADRPGLAILLDSQGKLANISEAAREMLNGAGPGIDDLAGRLHADDARRLREAVTEHVIHKRNVAPRILRGDDFHLIARTLRCDADREDFLCVETLVVDWSAELETVLEASFSLTPAERRVLRMLTAGDSVKAIALRFDRSEGTVRNQIKSILAKTGAGGIVLRASSLQYPSP